MAQITLRQPAVTLTCKSRKGFLLASCSLPARFLLASCAFLKAEGGPARQGRPPRRGLQASLNEFFNYTGDHTTA